MNIKRIIYSRPERWPLLLPVSPRITKKHTHTHTNIKNSNNKRGILAQDGYLGWHKGCALRQPQHTAPGFLYFYQVMVKARCHQVQPRDTPWNLKPQAWTITKLVPVHFTIPSVPTLHRYTCTAVLYWLVRYTRHDSRRKCNDLFVFMFIPQRSLHFRR